MAGKTELGDTFRKIFSENKKCIVNTDIDGIISGMLLQRFLNWQIAGYSCCCGKSDDEVWKKDYGVKFEECVFVDLPVAVREYSAIDQHFVALKPSHIEKYNSHLNKVNPNIMRGRALRNGGDDYVLKYPFGTAHFILAVLENMGVIGPDYAIDFRKKISSFDLADLILRADRVIGNTYRYSSNCLDWADWMIELGGKNTAALFDLVKSEYRARFEREREVEAVLLGLGCKGKDGDCSNLFREKDYDQLKKYFDYLGMAVNMPPLPVFDPVPCGKLKGERVKKDNIFHSQDKIFSFALVSKNLLSVTYFANRGE